MSPRIIHAIQVHHYGGPEELKFEEILCPIPQEGEVLVRVGAAGVNPIDWKIRAGWLKEVEPLPLPYIPGFDFAGMVEEVGPGVTAFQPGQAVFGQSLLKGTYTEYTVAPISTLAHMPELLSFEEAATVPTGAITAWQALVDHGQLQCGQRVLILGGAGGVGLFAVQFAHRRGAHVTSTASTANVEYVRSLGAETVLDYTTTSLVGNVEPVDLVLDTVGSEAMDTAWSVLKPGGVFVSTVAQPSEAKAHQLHARTVHFSMQSSGELLHTIGQWIESVQIQVTIARCFPLDQASQAHILSEQGHGRGRIVLQVGNRF